MTSADTVTLGALYRARRNIAPWVRPTPLVPSPVLSQRTGARVFHKLEIAHDTGAFKVRGATNRLVQLSPAERERGVVTVSTGNHGRAVAHAAARLGIRAVVCLSELVPQNKVQAIRDTGAEVRIHGRSQDEAESQADRLVEEQGMIPVHPFDHPDVIAGQGTIGLELLDALPDIDCALVGLSGGGLISGIAIALKAARPDIRVVGLTMERGAAMYESVRAGRPVAVEEMPTLADSLGGGIGLGNRWTFELVRRHVDDFVLLSEREIADGMRFLYEQERFIVEGAGAVGTAALLHDRVAVARSSSVVSILSGRNADMNAFTAVVTGRYRFD